MTSIVSRRAILAGGAIAVARPGCAQELWPASAIRIVVPAAAGGYDTFARLMAPLLSDRLGQPVYIENRAGGNGAAGMVEVARADPDGYTLLFASSSVLTINAALFRTTTPDAVASFAPIAHPVTVPMIWVAHRDSPFRSLRDVVAAARAEPGRIEYAHPGAGSLGHLTVEAFRQRQDLNIVPVPLNGAAAAQNEVLAGRIPLMVDSLGAARPHIDAKRLRALTITTRERLASMSGVLTMIEQGLSDREYVAWYGLLAPRDTPAEIVSRINAAVNEVLADPDASERLRALGAEPHTTTPADLRTTMIAEREHWGRVARKAGIVPR